MRKVLAFGKWLPVPQLTEILESCSYDLLTTNIIKKAHRMLETDPSIDLVFLETEDADGKGRQLLEAMRTNRRMDWIPIIAIGKAVNKDRAHQLLELRVNDIVILPASSDCISERFKKAIRDGKPNVLLVDDEPAILDILSETLELEGCRTITAESVEKALEHLRSYKVDLVISDILFPGMSGFELLAHSKENHPGIPVILITGYNGQYTPAKAMAAGAVRYLKKPFKNTELVFAMRSALESRSSSCQTTPTSGTTR